VTESAIMADPERAETLLRRFDTIGIELADRRLRRRLHLLAHLRTLPVQELKIDQSLVRQMSDLGRDTVIIRAIIDLAHNLGLRTVAEGVEDADTLDRLSILAVTSLRDSTCPPMPAAEFSRWSQRFLADAARRA
jgi:EAL domain-containing protein (putative c-di-GMP-specific phosphodiesterase class I)